MLTTLNLFIISGSQYLVEIEGIYKRRLRTSTYMALPSINLFLLAISISTILQIMPGYVYAHIRPLFVVLPCCEG